MHGLCQPSRCAFSHPIGGKVGLSLMHRQRTLVADTDRSRAKQLVYALTKNNISGTQALSLKEAQHKLDKTRHVAMILHENIAGGKLEEFCRSIREDDPAMIIIPLLAGQNGDLEERLFDLGVDDVTGEFMPTKVIVKRLMVRLNRRCQVNCTDGTVRIGDAIVDFSRLEVWHRRKLSPISNTLAGLLRHFLANCGEAISRQQITEGLWDDAIVDPEGKNFDVHVSKLRRLIEPDPKHPIFIQTVRGVGYKFIRCWRE